MLTDEARAAWAEGDMALGLGRYAEAVLAYDRLLVLVGKGAYSKHLIVQFNRGKALLALHRQAEALAAFREAHDAMGEIYWGGTGTAALAVAPSSRGLWGQQPVRAERHDLQEMQRALHWWLSQAGEDPRA